jgi:hypothetical protein
VLYLLVRALRGDQVETVKTVKWGFQLDCLWNIFVGEHPVVKKSQIKL